MEQKENREDITKLKFTLPGPGPIPYDEEAFRQTDIGRRRDELISLYKVYADAPLHPNVIRYWAERGLRKELYDNEGTYGFGAGHAYSVFTPLDLAPGKKYALLYVSHGGGHPIEWAETYGINTLAAVERYIVVYAQNGGRFNEEAEQEFGRITGQLREKGYPVDWERVYAVGFSSGSEASARIAAGYPEAVAAVGCMPDGIPFKNLSMDAMRQAAANMKGQRMPGIFIGGTVDKGAFPAKWMTGYFGSELGAGTVENTVENLNTWMRDIAGIRSYTPQSREGITQCLLEASDPVEREFGLRFDRSFTFRAQGTDWLGGEYFDGEGVPVMRWVRAIGVPHMVWESQANLVWDYLKHFRRDPQTGRSLYDPVTCWGER